MITHYTMKENNIAVVIVCTLYQKLVTCIYDYELESADGKFRKPFKSYLGEDVVCNFINSMTEKSKLCIDIKKNKLTRNLWWLKKIMDDEDFENSNEWWICDNAYVKGDVKVRDHCYIIQK